jgi:hypothetical protein
MPKDYSAINAANDARALEKAAREHGLKAGATWGDINKSSDERQKAYAELPEAAKHAVNAKAEELIPDALKNQFKGIEAEVRGDMARSLKGGKPLSEASEIAADRLVICREPTISPDIEIIESPLDRMMNALKKYESTKDNPSPSAGDPARLPRDPKLENVLDK